MKFYKLLKKEVKELLTIQALLGAIVMAGMFLLLGNVINSVGSGIMNSAETVVICDQDQTETSKGAIDYLTQNGVKVTQINSSSPVEMIKEAKKSDDHSAVLIIPAGFESGIASSKPQQLQIVSSLTSFAVASDNDPSAQKAADSVADYISEKSAAKGSIDAKFLKQPITTQNTTVVGDKSEIADADALKSFGMSQSIFIPIILFILVMMATQLNCAAIANEKTDKTLETLLSAPVSRLDVIGSKMCASVIYSVLMAAVFIVGYAAFMGTMTGASMPTDMTGGESLTGNMSGLSNSLETLGIKLGAGHFAMLGVQLFLTIAIALTISMILGALAKDIKATQGLITPLMFATMIPYIVTMVADVNTLPTVAKTLLYAIPFTHTFTATGNVLFGNMGMFWFGVAYQAVWLLGVVWLAVRVFSSDKIFTMTLEFKKKPKKVKV